MTHQFKFGDRVQDADGKQFVFLRGFLSSCTVAGDDGRTYDYLTNRLQPIPHPDTERLDWLAAQDDIDITLGDVINLKLPELRSAIDVAMQACIAAVAIKFAAHFEEMVARGEAERLPDGRYRIFEKAT